MIGPELYWNKPIERNSKLRIDIGVKEPLSPTDYDQTKGSMSSSRRIFIRKLGAAIAAAPLSVFAGNALDRESSAVPNTLAGRILVLFRPLPGIKSLKIFAPATGRARKFLVQLKPTNVLFVGSAFKTLVLCEALRLLDSPTVVDQLIKTQLGLNASVWAPDSQTLNPPNLMGMISERAALEAMIMHSDNTGTDMSILQTGIQNVRNFISSIGLTQTRVPESTRAFAAYLFGAPNYLNITWSQLEGYLNSDAPFVNLPLNNTITMASTTEDLVSYYSRALLGNFFTHPQTVEEYRRILSLGDAVLRVVPLGATGFGKGGSIDVPGFHALCIAGGMSFSNRWVFFATTINWDAAALNDPTTVAAFAQAVSSALKMVYEALS
jgi:beta-lactamase class A